jgi:hypothetical protein
MERSPACLVKLGQNIKKADEGLINKGIDGILAVAGGTERKE